MRPTARIVTASLFVALLSSATPVFAVSEKNVRTGSPKVAIMPTKATSAGEMAAQKATKIKTVVERMLSKLDNRLDNYEEFLERVRSRKEKMVVAGKNVTKVSAFILTAEENLKNARTTVAAAKVKLGQLDYSGDRKVVWTTVTAELKKVREALVKLHTSMAQTVRGLKEADMVKPEKGDKAKGE